MTKEEEKLLQEAYVRSIESTVYSMHIDNLEEVVVKDIMGYGTAVDEKCSSLSDFRDVIVRTKEQAEGAEMDIQVTPSFRRVSPNEDMAIFVDELIIIMLIDGGRHELFVRLTSVLEYSNEKWLLAHIHGSIPPENSENDTWHVSQWQRKNEELEKLVEERTAELKQSLIDLKAAQAQLIQSEKMASLGELTAGIAHEIQNPLNFVNNFSEVSGELIEEMNEEIKKEDYKEVTAIAVDLKQNLEKINHHGKRADAIVKGMLQHSRSSDGKMEPTDINALADEYFRLAYHGLRAKDKSFNATLKTDFDDSIGMVNMASQDIGRVILNLITNAFYVVDEKKKTGVENYEPTVTVSSKKEGATIAIKVTDNGNGIPKTVLDKIFQPFFTTKPTGQGTGLGLSLSYDIVKAHGGELEAETIEGEGTTFIINLPNQG